MSAAAAAAAASVVSDSVRPHRRQPTRLPRPWDSPGKNTEVGSHFLLQCMKVKSESEVAQSPSRIQLFVTPWTAAHQASLSLTNTQSLPKFMSIASVVPSSHLILLTPSSPYALNLSQHQGLFKELAVCIK